MNNKKNKKMMRMKKKNPPKSTAALNSESVSYGIILKLISLNVVSSHL